MKLAKKKNNKQFRYAEKEEKKAKEAKATEVAPLLRSFGKRSLLSDADCSRRLRRLSTKHDCDGYVEQFEEKEAEALGVWKSHTPRHWTPAGPESASDRHDGRVLKQEESSQFRQPEIKQSRQCRRSRGILPAWLARALKESQELVVVSSMGWLRGLYQIEPVSEPESRW